MDYYDEESENEMQENSKIQKIFGEFTDIDWTSELGNKSGNGNSFIFSLRDDSNFVKLKCLNKKSEVFHEKNTLC